MQAGRQADGQTDRQTDTYTHAQPHPTNTPPHTHTPSFDEVQCCDNQLLLLTPVYLAVAKKREEKEFLVPKPHLVAQVQRLLPH